MSKKKLVEYIIQPTICILLLTDTVPIPETISGRFFPQTLKIGIEVTQLSISLQIIYGGRAKRVGDKQMNWLK